MHALTLTSLIEGLTTQEIDSNLFSGIPIPFPLKRIFGGQVLAQALYAAGRTIDDDTRVPHSMHAYFLRPGDMSRSVIYDVDPIRDGRSFSTRRVVARQHGRAIFNASVSFQKRETGLEHQIEMPDDIPPPDDLQGFTDYMDDLRRKYPQMPQQPFTFPPDIIDVRIPSPIDPFNPEKMDPTGGFWFKFTKDIGKDPLLHRSALAFISDKLLMATALRPHGISFYNRRIIGASLDHAMWFHSEIKVDQWIYYYLDSPRAARSRGLNRGLFYTQDGMLMASTIQEGLMRLIDDKE